WLSDPLFASRIRVRPTPASTRCSIPDPRSRGGASTSSWETVRAPASSDGVSFTCTSCGKGGIHEPARPLLLPPSNVAPPHHDDRELRRRFTGAVNRPDDSLSRDCRTAAAQNELLNLAGGRL